MNNEERDLITRFIQRVGGAQQGGFAQGTPSQGAPGQGAPGQGSAPALPPIDREADALIAELFARFPEARYRITQMAFVGEHALIEAQNRIQRLEWEVQQARQQAQAAPQQPQQPSPWGAAAQPPQQQESRGFFGNLFGGPRQAPPAQQQYQQAPPQQPQYAPPPPQYPPGYNPGLLQPRGSGFFGSALTTAAGVAGGMLAANALTGLFSGHQGGFGGFGGTAQAAGFVPVAPPAGSENPWAAAPGASPVADPYDIGGAQKSPDDSGWFTPGQDPQADQGGWTQESADQSGAGQPPDQGGWDPADNSGWTDPGSDSGTDLTDDGSGGSDDNWT